MSMPNNICNGTEESLSGDRYYIISFSYGVLIVSYLSHTPTVIRSASSCFVLKALILAHVAVHHLWRRRNLKRNQTTVVEIASNTSKVSTQSLNCYCQIFCCGGAQKLKEEVYIWCNKVKNLTPYPRLISTGASPVEYGNGFGEWHHISSLLMVFQWSFCRG